MTTSTSAAKVAVLNVSSMAGSAAAMLRGGHPGKDLKRKAGMQAPLELIRAIVKR
ncbi:hypothetical protein D3C72_2577730 [compost metagenome]